MKYFLAKISFILVITTILISCSVTKNLEEDEYFLTNNHITVNEEDSNDETIKNLIKPKPNSLFLKYPLRLRIYHFANKNPDSTFTEWLHKKPKREQRLHRFLSKKQTIKLQHAYTGINNWFKKSGEAPALIDSLKIKKSIKTLDKYHQQNGWLDINTSYTINYSDNKKGAVNYNIETGEPYIIDSITQQIESEAVDSIYNIHKKKSFIKTNVQYRDKYLINERERITTIMRNSGMYTFEKESIHYINGTDSIKKTNWVEIFIDDKKIRDQDSSYKEPYKIFKISEVNIFTDFNYTNKRKEITDSTTYNKHNFYSFEKLRFKPKALSDAIFIKPNSIYKDINKTLTLTQLNNLRTFKYPNIKYILDDRDSTKTSLIANILLTPLKKFELEYNLDALHNNIQNVGLSLSTSILARNVFRGAESLELAFRGSIGASKDAADREDRFFDVREFGADLKLSFPRILFPFNTSKFIPKIMSPTTRISFGASTQTNIGLDKTNFTGVFNYSWFSSAHVTNRFDLFNMQFVNNLNKGKYFDIYNNSYDKLNAIAINSGYTTASLNTPEGTSEFTNDVLTNNLTPSVSALISSTDIQEIKNIEERRQRLTEDNLIFTTSYSYIKNTRSSIIDNNFNRIGVKLELAGNTLSTLSNALGLNKNSNDRYELFNVAYSQYIKTEIDYIKYWNLPNNNTFAIRSFFGIAIPYGNSKSIPFSRSFFGGGSNDNRAWDAYSLGPGISGGQNEFNEANMKIALNAEFRYTFFGDLKGAFFIDAGNIWNVLDNEEDPKYKFDSLKDLSELAVGSGIGFRYDFSFFVLRFDIGFKTYEPYLENKKWLRNYNFRNAVYNVGINYPF
ncbi:MAG: BamA/TamA family outer membrane protein [Flavobacteriaceae bacterium]|nr:BamA/TamA family outer membrane protein [Flavobacteriaceae bacterium]